jgi:hypothetical protein
MPECQLCEQMLTDAVDEVLIEADQVWFDRHIAACAACSRALEEARRGAALLDLLRMSPPEPSAALFDRIMAQTSGVQANLPEFEAPMLPAELIEPQAAPSNLLPFRPRPSFLGLPRVFVDTRLAMTAAMAFFSVALTLNLAGVRLNEVHARDLKPQNLRRSFFALEASAVRSYDNLRMVHVLESRVDALREDEDLRQAQQPTQQPEEQPHEQEQKRQAAPAEPNRNQLQNRNEQPNFVPATGLPHPLQTVSLITSPASLPTPVREATKDLS